MGLVFIGPILASSVLPLLARPTFVLQEVAGNSLFSQHSSFRIYHHNRCHHNHQIPILRDPSQRHPPWCLSSLHPLLYRPWKLSPTVLVLLWPHLPSSAGWQIDTLIWLSTKWLLSFKCHFVHSSHDHPHHPDDHPAHPPHLPLHQLLLQLYLMLQHVPGGCWCHQLDNW